MNHKNISEMHDKLDTWINSNMDRNFDCLFKSSRIIKFALVLSVHICFMPIARSQTVNPYQLSFGTLNNGQISLATYRGKKVLISLFDAGNPNRKWLAALDTLYLQNINSIVVIAVPVTNFQAAVHDINSLKKLIYDTLKLSYPVTAVSKAKKTDGVAQHSLLAWLTNINQNAHFDVDIDKVGEMFVLSENGKLFARLKEPIPANGKDMKKILMQQVAY